MLGQLSPLSHAPLAQEPPMTTAVETDTFNSVVYSPTPSCTHISNCKVLTLARCLCLFDLHSFMQISSPNEIQAVQKAALITS
jgi:hypothetical protein